MNRIRLFLLAFALLLLAFAPTARAQFGPARAKVALYASQSALAPGGEARLAVTVDLEDGWHAQSAAPYTKELIATVLTLNPTPGLTFGDIRYPRGEDEKSDPKFGFGPKISIYRHSIIILVPVKAAADIALGSAAIEGKLYIQYCNDKTRSCDPPINIPVKLSLPIAAAGTPQNADLFTDADTQQFYNTEEIPKPAPPATNNALTNPAANAEGIDVPLHTEKEQLDYIKQRDFAPANDVVYPVWMLILFALAGGVILNIMPCVLPVIPLKVLSLVQQANGDRKHSLYHALVFSAGIISLFLLLGGILRTFNLFYGQQFQSTLFLTCLGYFVLALALSMIGVWTINTPTAVYSLEKPRSGYAGSFMSGLLATLLATPCSAPLLGPFLAWALVQPAWLTILSLALIGVGMSIPYVILAAFPGALSKIPTAGRWAELLKQGLGIVMIGVSFYLITRIANVEYWTAAFFGAVVVAAVCWGWGQIPSPTADPKKMWTVRLIVVAIGAGLGVLVAMITLPAQAPVTEIPKVVRVPNISDGKTWLPFNTALLEEARRQKRTVIVDWTANWCINCRAVEVGVLDTDAIRAQFALKNAILLRADLSGKNEPAEKLNEKLKGHSIPVLAIFSPTDPLHPNILRDFYTAGDLTTLLAK